METRLNRLIALMLVSLSGLVMAQEIPMRAPREMVMPPSVKQKGITPAAANISYDGLSDAQRLDLYLPDDGDGLFPVVVYVHGGGFRFGSRTIASAAIVKGFLQAGYAVASVDYRLSGEAIFPAAVQDVFAAMAFLKQNAASLRIDANNLVLYGESAGANLVSLAGTAYDNTTFRQNVANASLNLKPQAVIAHYPPVDFLQIDPMLKAQGCGEGMLHNDADSFESAYIGQALPSAPDKVAQANPARYASADTPRFFIQNGDADCNVGAGQSALLAAALDKAGAFVVYEQLPGAGHGGPQFETPDNIVKMFTFLKQH